MVSVPTYCTGTVPTARILSKSSAADVMRVKGIGPGLTIIPKRKNAGNDGVSMQGAREVGKSQAVAPSDVDCYKQATENTSSSGSVQEQISTTMS